MLASKAAYEKGLTVADKLPGKSLGVTQVGSSFHYQLGQIATANKFDIKSVDMKPLQSLPNMVAALKGSQVDSIIIAPQLAKPLIASGDAKLLGAHVGYRRLPVRRPVHRAPRRSRTSAPRWRNSCAPTRRVRPTT